MLDHVGIQADDMDVASTYYDAVLATLGYRRIMDHGVAIGYGDRFPHFWISAATDLIPNRQFHVAFQAPSREAVDAFVEAARSQGMQVLHEPRVWPEYHDGYYGGFVRDPDGNNVEAVHHTFE